MSFHPISVFSRHARGCAGFAPSVRLSDAILGIMGVSTVTPSATSLLRPKRLFSLPQKKGLHQPAVQETTVTGFQPRARKRIELCSRMRRQVAAIQEDAC